MAIPTNIKTLLSGDVVEWARIEFKETWDAEASLKQSVPLPMILTTGVEDILLLEWKKKMDVLSTLLKEFLQTK